MMILEDRNRTVNIADNQTVKIVWSVCESVDLSHLGELSNRLEPYLIDRKTARHLGEYRYGEKSFKKDGWALRMERKLEAIIKNEELYNGIELREVSSYHAYDGTYVCYWDGYEVLGEGDISPNVQNAPRYFLPTYDRRDPVTSLYDWKKYETYGDEWFTMDVKAELYIGGNLVDTGFAEADSSGREELLRNQEQWCLNQIGLTEEEIMEVLDADHDC